MRALTSYFSLHVNLVRGLRVTKSVGLMVNESKIRQFFYIYLRQNFQIHYNFCTFPPSPLVIGHVINVKNILAFIICSRREFPPLSSYLLLQGSARELEDFRIGEALGLRF